MHNLNLNIVPYVAVGNVCFEMTPAEVEVALGTPTSTSKTHLGGRVDFYDLINVGYTISSNPVVNHVGGGRDAKSAEILGVRLFADDPHEVIRQLVAKDGDPKKYLGFVILLNLGISLTGFHDDDVSQLAFSAFAKGAWDARLQKLKPFTL